MRQLTETFRWQTLILLSCQDIPIFSVELTAVMVHLQTAFFTHRAVMGARRFRGNALLTNRCQRDVGRLLQSQSAG